MHFSVCVASCCTHLFNFWRKFKMFSKLGRWLTYLAIISFIVEIIFIFIISIVLIILNGNKIIILSFAFSSVFSVLMISLILYVVGGLIVKYSTIQKTTAQKNNSSTEIIICDNCQNNIIEYPCLYCGYSPELKDAPYWCGTCFYAGPYDGDCPKCGSCLKEMRNKNQFT